MFELGNNLREARQRRRIDLVIAEQGTKIRSKYLAALETEEFDVLPGPVFVRGFLRTYSRYLGLDPQLFVDEYNARFGRFEEVEEHASPALGRPGLAQERDQRGRRTMRVVAVITLVAIAALAWVGLRSDDRRPTEQGSATPGAAQPSTAPAAEATTPQPGALDTAAAAAAGTTPASAAGTAKAKPKAAAKPAATTPAPTSQDR